MDNTDTIARILKEGKEAYLKDDFYDVAIRIASGTETYLKHKGRKEVTVPRSYDLICEVILGGEFITEEEYLSY